MTLILKRLQKIYINLWNLYNPVFILDKNYITLLFDKFTQKSQVLILKSKIKFFQAFKLYFSKTKVCKSKLDCLETNSGREFISITFQTFYLEQKIRIGYTILYIYKENGIKKQCWKILIYIKDLLLIENRLSNSFQTKIMNITNYL